MNPFSLSYDFFFFFSALFLSKKMKQQVEIVLVVD